MTRENESEERAGGRILVNLVSLLFSLNLIAIKN